MCPGTFDHHLHVVFPGFFGQLAENFQFRELRFVAGVGQAAGTQAIAERKADVVLLENFADGVEILVQEILLFVEAHPLRQQRAAAADDSGDAVAHQRQKFAQHAGVNRHVVHALLGLLFDHFEHQLDGQILGAPHAREGFVNRHGADGHGRRVDDGFADHGNVAAGGKVHHRVRAVVHGAVQLFEFFVDVRSGGGVADVRVDFAEEGDADAHRLQIAMIDVGGNDGAAARNFVAHQLWRELFAFGDVLHFFGDDALARVVHLREVARAAAAVHRCRSTFFNPCIPHRHKAPVYTNPEAAAAAECSIITPRWMRGNRCGDACKNVQIRAQLWKPRPR